MIPVHQIHVEAIPFAKTIMGKRYVRVCPTSLVHLQIADQNALLIQSANLRRAAWDRNVSIHVSMFVVKMQNVE